MSIDMYQWYTGVNLVIKTIQAGDKICLFPLQCYWLWLYWSFSEGAYVFTGINYKRSAYHDGLNDLNYVYEPTLTSKFYSVGSLIFWFTLYHPSSLNIINSTIGFELSMLMNSFLILTDSTCHLLLLTARMQSHSIRRLTCCWSWNV